MTLESIAFALVALAVVIGLILMAQRAARWGGLAPLATGTRGRLALVEAIALDPRRRLSLVRCDGRDVLLLTGGPQDIVVGWTEAMEKRP